MVLNMFFLYLVVHHCSVHGIIKLILYFGLNICNVLKKCCVIQVFWYLAVHHWLLVAVMQACVVYWIHHVVIFRIVVLNLLNKLSCIWLYTTVVYGCYTISFGFF